MGTRVGAVETGGTWTACAVGEIPNGPAVAIELRTRDAQQTLGEVVEFFTGAAARDGGPIAALGIGAFGPIDLRSGSPTWGRIGATPKRGWSGLRLATTLGERLGVPVALETDVGAAALAEHRYGAGRGCGSVAYLTVGTGIGLGLVLGGTPWHGFLHPEAGHMRVAPRFSREQASGAAGFAGVCPFHGDCWEGLASGPAIAARWGAEPDSLPPDHPAWALEAELLAAGLWSIVTMVAPERIVLGGGVMEAAGLLDRVRAALRETAAGYLDTPLLHERITEYVAAPELGDRAGVVGALALAADLAAGG